MIEAIADLRLDEHTVVINICSRCRFEVVYQGLVKSNFVGISRAIYTTRGEVPGERLGVSDSTSQEIDVFVTINQIIPQTQGEYNAYAYPRLLTSSTTTCFEAVSGSACL